MVGKEIVKYSLNALQEIGAEKAQCQLTQGKKYEMNVVFGEVYLLRTTFETYIELTAIKGGKKANITINKLDSEAISEAAKNVMELVETAEADEAYDIAPNQSAEEFVVGSSEPDLQRMYTLAKQYAQNVEKNFPKVKLFETALTFNSFDQYFMNSNGVDFNSSKGTYYFNSVFSAKDGEKSSSFNYTGVSMTKLEKDLLDCGTVRELLKQSVEQLDTKSVVGKFEGDIILTPDCLGDFVDMFTWLFLRDGSLISETSLLKDKLNESIASPLLTIHSKPVSEEIGDGYFYTSDGFKAENLTFIEKGVLKSFLLSLYGANKTKRERAKNGGGAYVVEPGSKSLDEIVKTIQKGIIVGRYSGGSPAPNGDFSGVAKNSYYVENGEIKYPVSETMIAGNLLDVFKNIRDITAERVDFGRALLPWVCSSGVIISGK